MAIAHNGPNANACVSVFRVAVAIAFAGCAAATPPVTETIEERPAQTKTASVLASSSTSAIISDASAEQASVEPLPPAPVSSSAAPDQDHPPRAELCTRAGYNICLWDCDELVARLDTRVAPRVVACLKTANSGGTCVPPKAYACVQKALTGVARNPEAESACDQLADKCAGHSASPGWRALCSRRFAALTERGRNAVIRCMSANKCLGMDYFNDDVGSCLFDNHVA